MRFIITASAFSYHAGVKTRWSLSNAAIVRHGNGDSRFFWTRSV
jgi:hypothetical protein